MQFIPSNFKGINFYIYIISFAYTMKMRRIGNDYILIVLFSYIIFFNTDFRPREELHQLVLRSAEPCEGPCDACRILRYVYTR